MTGTTDTKQRLAVMPTAAPVGPVLRDLGWLEGTVERCDGSISGSTHGFTANRFTRHLGRSST